MSIAVFLESYQGKMAKASLETLKAATVMAEKLGISVFGIIIDDTVDTLVQEAGKFGVATVKSSAGVTIYHPTMYARIITNATKDASAVFLPATVWGNEIAPMVAVKLDATPVSDIIGIEDVGTFKRSIHGNKIHTTVKAEGNLVVTVRSGVFDLPGEVGGSASNEPISTETVDSDNFIKLAEVLVAQGDRPELTEADIVVSGGRGTGGPENFAQHIEPLADAMGAAVGASRAVVDAGWRPHGEQVGQTGKFVSPKVYVAVGISGAIQHLAGMSTADVIVAINTDSEAPIFKVADYGVVGDLNDVVPKLVEAIKQVKAA